MRRGGWIRTKRIGRDDEEIAISKRNAIAKRKSNRKLVDRSTLTIRRKIEKSFIDDDDASNSFCRMRKPEAQRRLFPKFSSYRITSTSTLRRKRKNEKREREVENKEERKVFFIDPLQFTHPLAFYSRQRFQSRPSVIGVLLHA